MSVAVSSDVSNIQSNEFSLVHRGLAAHFVGDGTRLFREVQTYFSADVPAQSKQIRNDARDGFTFVVEREGRTETFAPKKRLASGHAVWALSLADKARFAAIMGWTEKEKIPLFDPATEFAFTSTNLKLNFVGCGYAKLKQIHSHFPPGIPELPEEIRKYSSSSFTIRFGEKENAETFTPQKRRAGKHVVWALPLTQRFRFAAAIKLIPRTKTPRFDPKNEFSFSSKNLLVHFVGTGRDLQEKIEKIFPDGVPFHPEEIRRYPHESFTLSIETGEGKEIFVPQKRFVTSSAVWALPLSEKERFASAAGIVARELTPIGSDKISITPWGLSQHFVCDKGDISRMQGVLPQERLKQDDANKLLPEPLVLKKLQ